MLTAIVMVFVVVMIILMIKTSPSKAIMVDNTHIAFAATRLNQGASVSPEEGIVLRIGICS